MKHEREQTRDTGKRLALSLVALVTAASVAIGGLFSSPAALAEEPELNPVMCSADDGDGDEGAAEPETLLSDEEEERRGLRARLRQAILRLPLAVRLLVILPLWALGWGLRAAAGALWGSLLSPLLGRVLGWLLLLAALLLGFAAAAKAIFPDLPLKKILKRRSLTALSVGLALLALADGLLPLFWADYSRLAPALRLLGSLLLFGAVVLGFALREQRRRREAPEPEPKAEAAPLTREEILALADSVK